MARESIWNDAHADFLAELITRPELTTQDLSTRMSQRFRVRITTAHVGSLLNRMRRYGDPLYRATPYKNRGAKFSYRA